MDTLSWMLSFSRQSTKWFCRNWINSNWEATAATSSRNASRRTLTDSRRMTSVMVSGGLHADRFVRRDSTFESRPFASSNEPGCRVINFHKYKRKVLIVSSFVRLRLYSTASDVSRDRSFANSTLSQGKLRQCRLDFEHNALRPFFSAKRNWLNKQSDLIATISLNRLNRRRAGIKKRSVCPFSGRKYCEGAAGAGNMLCLTITSCL